MSAAKKKMLIITISSAACLLTLALILTAFLLRTNASEPQEQVQWLTYYEKEQDATIYTHNTGGKIFITVCTCIAGIDCSVHLEHSCTPEQFALLQRLLQEKGVEYRGLTEAPDTENYPDLTDYLPLVMSSDEMHELWQQLGLE